MTNTKPERITLVACKDTQGAKIGTKVMPYAKDVDKWLAKGWVKVDVKPKTAPAPKDAL